MRILKTDCTLKSLRHWRFVAAQCDQYGTHQLNKGLDKSRRFAIVSTDEVNEQHVQSFGHSLGNDSDKIGRAFLSKGLPAHMSTVFGLPRGKRPDPGYGYVHIVDGKLAA